MTSPRDGDLDPVLHQPVRLRIVAALHRYREVDFPSLRDGLDLTPGNLSTHLARLEEVGYMESRRVLAGLAFQVRYRITPAGSEAFVRYLAAMRGLLASLQEGPSGFEPRSQAVRRAMEEKG